MTILVRTILRAAACASRCRLSILCSKLTSRRLRRLLVLLRTILIMHQVHEWSGRAWIVLGLRVAAVTSTALDGTACYVMGRQPSTSSSTPPDTELSRPTRTQFLGVTDD